jgi:hypothetical protein
MTVDVLKDTDVMPTDAASKHDKSYTSAAFPRQAGINAFRGCKLRELTQQKRAENDAEHTAFIQNMRTFNIANPISDDLLRALERRVLTSEDMNDPEWECAPICVTSNAERFSLMKAMAKKYAKRHGLPVVVWEYPTKAKTPLKNDANRKDYSELYDQVIKHTALRSQLFQTSAGTMGMFVKGAPAYILENCNTDKRLSNGSFVRMHSLTFDDKNPDHSDRIREIELLIENASPGEEVTISLVPKYINVTFEPDKEEGKSWPDNENLGAGPDEIVVPMPEQSKRRLLDVIIDFNPAGFDVKRQLGVECTVHRVCLGFTLTCHKLQGATVKKLILELNQRPFQPHFTYYMLLVALSRVSSGADIRIMPLFTKEGQKVSPLAYLKKLRPDDNLRIWFAGFRRQCDGGDGSWDPVLALAEKHRLDELKSASKTTVKRSISSSKSKTAKTSATITSRSDTDKAKGKSRKLQTGDSARRDSANKDLQRDLTSPPYAAAPSFQPPPSRRQQQFWDLTDEQHRDTIDFVTACRNANPDDDVAEVDGRSVLRAHVANLHTTDWIHGSSIDAFLAIKYIDFRHSILADNQLPCTILTSDFSHQLINGKQHWGQLTQFTAQLPSEYLKGDIVFSYGTGSHFLSCIISKTELCIYVIDGYDRPSGHRLDIIELIKAWYTMEYVSRRLRPPDYVSDGWQFLTGGGLPQTRPLQTDAHSCGPLTAFTILHYMLHRRLPIERDTFAQQDAPQLRAYMAHTIFQVYSLRLVSDEANIARYAARLNGERLSDERIDELLESMGLQRNDRGIIDAYSQPESSSTTSSTSRQPESSSRGTKRLATDQSLKATPSKSSRNTIAD